jgi:hypothetical protein
MFCYSHGEIIPSTEDFVGGEGANLPQVQEEME